MDNIYKIILEDTLAGFWEWNIPTGAMYFSPAFKAMFGYTDYELEPNMQTWQSMVYPDDLAPLNQSIKRHVDSKGEITHHIEVRYLHKDGSAVWVICAGQIVEWDNDEPIRMAGCHINIDRQKKLLQ